MALRIATFNAENLMQRFDFSGYRNELRRDRTLQMVDVKDEQQFRDLEQARVISHADDKMQLTALAISDTNADIICLQEVENLSALQAFEYGYLFKMAGAGYMRKYLVEGNDGRGIDVAVMTRDETADGDPIEFVSLQSHAQYTYESAGVFNRELKEIGELPHERVFRRDCLEIDLRIGGKPLTLFVVHFKAPWPDPETAWAQRRAEALAVRRLIARRFDDPAAALWLVAGDLNDPQHDTERAVAPLLQGFSVDLAARVPEGDRWTWWHEEGRRGNPDALLASPALAARWPLAVPQVVRAGMGRDAGGAGARFEDVGARRPHASDHAALVLDLPGL